MCGLTVRTPRLTALAWQGVYSTPLHPHDQGGFPPPVEPRSRARPCTRQWSLRRSLGTHRPRRVRPWNQTGGYRTPRPLAGAFAAPAPTSRRLSCPCTLTRGNPSPLDLTPRRWPERRRRALSDDTLSPPQGETFPFPDPLASARLMARAAGFEDDLARFIIAKARGGLVMREGVA